MSVVLNGGGKRHSAEAAVSRRRPWPMSPNITPNRNGNVTEVKKAGFNSLYEGTPYVFTIRWNV
jgi:hypothetical protein